MLTFALQIYLLRVAELFFLVYRKSWKKSAFDLLQTKIKIRIKFPFFWNANKNLFLAISSSWTPQLQCWAKCEAAGYSHEFQTAVNLQNWNEPDAVDILFYVNPVNPEYKWSIKSLVKAIISYQDFTVISYALCSILQNNFKHWKSSLQNTVILYRKQTFSENI